MNNGPQLRGHGLFLFFYNALRATHTKGLWAGVTSLRVGVRRYVVERATVAAVYAWKARQVWHWRWSPKINEEAYQEREGICDDCETLKLVGDERYPDRESRYCGSCGCKDWRWSELTVKHRHRGHKSYICALLKFPEQEEQRKQAEEAREAMEKAQAARAKNPGGCGGGCDSNGRGHALEDFHRNSGLLASTRGRS